MAGSIAILQVTASQMINWNASRVDPLKGTRISNTSISLSQVFSNPTGSNLVGNQCIAREITLVGGANSTIDLSAAMTNVLGDATATIVYVKAAIIWLPKVSQNASYGTAASGITIGAAASLQTTIFGLGSTNALTVNNGEMLSWMTPGAGVSVASNKSFKIVNNDGSVTANIILVLIGNDT